MLIAINNNRMRYCLLNFCFYVHCLKCWDIIPPRHCIEQTSIITDGNTTMSDLPATSFFLLKSHKNINFPMSSFDLEFFHDLSTKILFPPSSFKFHTEKHFQRLYAAMVKNIEQSKTMQYHKAPVWISYAP